ncbi:DUF5004 domain-containing protein [Mariniflexile gromovii]|uniref:DUF5004 domain-containing protein n=1 Tax=Mariniflexile gromovii TaxID=362523 RepID=A0ABS4BUE9_9FLAO|nr:DUF5004 domain-containing protein [Mariniflexile gromovii]MBP0904216.1 DUF5004 domain-containing protein [Mariniflexile gromovii]
MKKTILLVKSLMLVGVLALSCDNDNGPDCPNALTGELTTTETAFTGNWTLKSIVAEEEVDLTDDDVDNPSTDIYAQSSDCFNDLVYNFGTNRTYTLKQGENATDCNEIEINGTWALNSGTLSLVASCSIESIALDFNDDDTEFSYTTTLRFKDVNDLIIDSDVVFTYEKNIP